MSTDQPALRTDGLTAQLAGDRRIIEDIDLEIEPGEIVALVGESGSGKTTTALSLFGYHPDRRITSSGRVVIAGEDMSDQYTFRSARGRLISYVPQNPGSALNPSMRIITAVEDMIRAHDTTAAGAADTSGRALKLLQSVGLPSTEQFADRYPHQVSGGQQQRVCIALSIASNPAVVVLDEPTTGLDVVTQRRILEELRRLRDEQNVAMLYITHDLAVVSDIADRIAVMYAGRIVEQGPSRAILRNPRHPYTRGLVASTPDHLRPRVLRAMDGIAAAVGQRPQGCAFAPRCSQRTQRCIDEDPPRFEVAPAHGVRCFEWMKTPSVPADSEPGGRVPGAGADRPLLRVRQLQAKYRGTRDAVVVAQDVTFDVERGTCTALVGESGSGKTTIARVIAGLHPLAAGSVRLDDEELPGLARRRTAEQRRRVQIVFQNPAEALNPRHTVESAIARPARQLNGLGRREAEREVKRLLEAVRLPAGTAAKYPAELSGGECQRVALARALAARPDLLVCDEVTSALDVSVQAVVLELLLDLRDSMGLTMLFITHDFGVTAAIADYVLVLRKGEICERGPVRDVLRNPSHEYTRQLLESAPSLSASVNRWDQIEGISGQHV